MRTVCLFLLLLLLPAAARAETLFLKAAKVYTLAGETLSPGMVLIEDGKIKAVGKDLTPPAGAKVIDVKDGVILPGFINAYSHTGVEGQASEETREVTPAFRASRQINWRSREFKEALADGITSQFVTPDTEAVFGGQGCVVKSAGKKPSDRTVTDGLGLFVTTTGDPGGGNSARGRPDTIYNRLPTNRMGVVWMLRQQFTAAKHGKQADLEPLREALAGKRPVFCVSQSAHEIQSLLSICDEVGLKEPRVIGGYEAHRMAKELADRKVPVLLDPVNNRTSAGGDFEQAYWNQPLALHQAGVPFAITGNDPLTQARFAVRHGLPAEAALAAITKAPAAILGVADRVGTLEAGKDADLVVLTGDPLNFTTTVRFTVIGGVVHGKED